MVGRLARLALLVGLLPVAGFLLFFAARPKLPATLPRADGAAVLTGAAGRTEMGFALLASGHVRRLLISGAHPDATLADIAREARVETPPMALANVGRVARSTRGNAREIADWASEAGLHSVVVVTSRSHMRRALLELGRAAPGLVLVACPVADPPGGLGLRRAAAEYVKFLGALLGLSGLAPGREAAA